MLILSDRDHQVVQLVGRFGVLTSTQIYRLVFANVTRTPLDRSLKRLVKHNYLHCIGTAKSNPNKGGEGPAMYQLGLEGWHDQLKTKRWRELTDSNHVSHSLNMADVFVRLVEAHNAGKLVLREFELEVRLSGLQPDIYTSIAATSGGRAVPYFIEVDRGTQSSKVIQAKLQAYLKHYGASDAKDYPDGYPRVLFLSLTPARVRYLKHEVALLKPHQREMFMMKLLWEWP